MVLESFIINGEYRGKNKETRQSLCDAVVQWMMATYFKLTLLVHVHFPPHKPYIVATFTHNMNFKSVRTMVNGEPRMQHCKSRLRKYEENTHASQQYRAVLLVSQNFNSVIDLQHYCRFAKGYSHNVSHCAYPLCTVSNNSKTLQVCVCMCVKHITAKK